MQKIMTIAGRRIGGGEPPYLVAEISGNHLGSRERAAALIDAAAEAGADAVKLQCYAADAITIRSARKEFLITQGPWAGRTLHDLYAEAETPAHWLPGLFAHARKRGMAVFASVFDEASINTVAALDTPAYKIASPEAVDLPLIRAAARQGKPLIISTGMCTLVEIGKAVDAARRAGAEDIALLHCTSAYPAPVEEANLATMAALASGFGVVTGYSDHTSGTVTAVAAAARGAAIIEKHLTLARSDGGPDASFSLEPSEFADLAASCRAAWQAIGSVRDGPASSERGSLAFRRSLYAVKDIAAGETISPDMIRSIRPAQGLPPGDLDAVIGMKAKGAIAAGEPLAWSMLEL